jgi:cytochrome c biogenesis protein CcdA
MLRLIGLVVSIGLADSLNPTTIAPALYLATGEHARRRVIEFTLGVLLVYFVGGALIALGPGQLLLALVPKPDTEDRHVIEIVVGVAMLVAAAILWRNRETLSHRRMPAASGQGKSSAILGATITAVELPTAFPYFAAIAAIVGSGLDPVRQLLLLLVFNVCFVLPLILMVVAMSLAGDGAIETLTRGRDFLERRWPVVLSVLLLVAGVFVVLLGATAFAGRGNSRVGRFFRHVHHIIGP